MTKQEAAAPADTRSEGQAAAESNPDDEGEGVASIEKGQPFGPGDDQAGTPRSGDDQAEAVQASSDGATPSTQVSASGLRAAMGVGTPLPTSVGQTMGSFFGADFSSVRVHADAVAGDIAGALSARALTVGEDIAFAPQRYQPHTESGRRLLVHELTHVVQQRRGLGGSILRDGIGQPGDVYEVEAERMADRFVSHPTRTTEPGGRVQAGLTLSPVAVQLFSKGTAVSYARKWALGTNPAYGDRFENDCTNFVSQTMEAGGWSQIVGADRCEDRKKDSVWWFKRDGCPRWIRSNIHASHTWGGADNFFRFLKVSGRGTLVSKVSDLEEGDVLQRDHGDGTIHHTTLVTRKGDADAEIGGSTTRIAQVWLSYHTNDNLDRPFWGKGGFHETSKPGWKYYGWTIS